MFSLLGTVAPKLEGLTVLSGELDLPGAGEQALFRPDHHRRMSADRCSTGSPQSAVDTLGEVDGDGCMRVPAAF